MEHYLTRVCGIFTALMCFCFDNAVDGLRIVPKIQTDRKYLVPGLDKLDLFCQASADGLAYSWTKESLSPAGTAGNAVTVGDDSKSLSLNPVQTSDAGRYTCTDQNGFSDTYTPAILGPSFLVGENLTANGTSSVILKCNQRFDPVFPLIWFWSNNSIITSSPGNDNRVTLLDAQNNYSLQLKSLYRYPDMFGSYRCQINATANGTLPPQVLSAVNALSSQVLHQAKPDVKIDGSTGKPKTVFYGESVVLRCVIQGHEGRDRVKWLLHTDETNQDTVLVNSSWRSIPFCSAPEDKQKRCPLNNSRLKIGRDWEFEVASQSSNHSSGYAQNFLTSVLYIDRVDKDNQGSYTCYADNEYGENSDKLSLSVKDKRPALWAFLAMIGEVCVLCTMIFIYERRRIKRMKDRPQTNNLTMMQEIKETTFSKPV